MIFFFTKMEDMGHCILSVYLMLYVAINFYRHDAEYDLGVTFKIFWLLSFSCLVYVFDMP